MPARFPIIFSTGPSQTSHSIVDSDATASSRTRSSTASTTITMLEVELGMCEPPKSGLLSKLHIHIPKRKNPTTQGPKPHQSPSFTGGIWSTLWDCGLDGFDVNLPRPPLKDVGCPPGSFPDYHANGEQDSELGQDVATPTNGTACSSDEELTPLFSSNFPRTLHPNTLGAEVTLMESSRESAPQFLSDLTQIIPIKLNQVFEPDGRRCTI